MFCNNKFLHNLKKRKIYIEENAEESRRAAIESLSCYETEASQTRLQCPLQNGHVVTDFRLIRYSSLFF